MNQANAVKTLPKYLTVSDSGVSVTLKFPVTINEVATDKVLMRSPCVRDVRAANAAANGDDEKRELSLFCSLIQCSEADLEGLKYTDYQRLQRGYFRLVADDEL